MFKTDDHHDGLVVGLSKRERERVGERGREQERETSKQTNKQINKRKKLLIISSSSLEREGESSKLVTELLIRKTPTKQNKTKQSKFLQKKPELLRV